MSFNGENADFDDFDVTQFIEELAKSFGATRTTEIPPDVMTFEFLLVPETTTQAKAKKPSTSADFLKTAYQIQAERAKEYEQEGGERSAARIAQAFNAITGREGDRALNEADAWLFLQVLKQVRLFNVKGFHEDSAVDNVSYASLLAEAKKRGA